MYAITSNGHKLPVDDSSIPKNERISHLRTVHLIDDNDSLKKIWILELNKKNWNSNNFELDFIQELEYEHEPTQEEIMWAMSTYNAYAAFVKEAYRWQYPDE